MQTTDHRQRDRDTGSGEFYQIYRYDPADGSVVLLTGEDTVRDIGTILEWSVLVELIGIEPTTS